MRAKNRKHTHTYNVQIHHRKKQFSGILRIITHYINKTTTNTETLPALQSNHYQRQRHLTTYAQTRRLCLTDIHKRMFVGHW